MTFMAPHHGNGRPQGLKYEKLEEAQDAMQRLTSCSAAAAADLEERSSLLVILSTALSTSS